MSDEVTEAIVDTVVWRLKQLDEENKALKARLAAIEEAVEPFVLCNAVKGKEANNDNDV